MFCRELKIDACKCLGRTYHGPVRTFWCLPMTVDLARMSNSFHKSLFFDNTRVKFRSLIRDFLQEDVERPGISILKIKQFK